MKKLLAATGVIVLLANMPIAGWANDGASTESKCQKQAARDRVTSDRLKAYMDSCISRHDSTATDSGQNSGGSRTEDPNMNHDSTMRNHPSTNAPGTDSTGNGPGSLPGTGTGSSGR